MHARELDYDLPPELIAQEPLPEREASRLLVMNVDSGRLRHEHVRDLAKCIRPSLLVVNDTRVIAARMRGQKESGGAVELLLIEPLAMTDVGAMWLAWGRASKPLRPGALLRLEAPDGGPETGARREPLSVEVKARRPNGELEILLRTSAPVETVLDRYGELPLPPYIERSVTALDSERYQTVFADRPGAIAAPTAGLHFSTELLDALQAEGHRVAKITLHVGPGTFAPLRTDDLAQHPMHEERFEVSTETAQAIRDAKREGIPVLAIGTTVVRTLEAAVNEDGDIDIDRKSTALFIYPPYRFRVVDAMFTNFHLPRSTLLALVMAFGGIERVRAAYAAAVANRYRFFSYGDAMLLANSRLLRDA